MSPAPRPLATVCYPLQEDTELAEANTCPERGIDPTRRISAVGVLAARQLDIPTGPWAGNPVPIENGIGLLVLEGVLVHRIGIGDRFGAELLGEGDILRSLAGEGESSPLQLSRSWIVLEQTRLAVLDERFVHELAAFPQLAGRRFARAVLRTRQLAVNLAIVHQARVDVRLHMLVGDPPGGPGQPVEP